MFLRHVTQLLHLKLQLTILASTALRGAFQVLSGAKIRSLRLTLAQKHGGMANVAVWIGIKCPIDK
jgi:hypothetical protein